MGTLLALFTLSISLSCLDRAAGLISVAGYAGQEVKVSCHYGEGYQSYEKYFCRYDCSNDDILLSTGNAPSSKYSIHDDQVARVFTVTISELSLSDAGKYWCGVTRTGKDIYQEVKLEVGPETCCDQSTTIQSDEGQSVSLSCLYKSEHKSSLKYMCRGSQTAPCLQQALVTSENPQNGHFELTDDEGRFTVTISHSKPADSGLYLCGVQKTGLDSFSAINLQVKDWCCVKSVKLSGTAGHPLTLQCPYPRQHKDNRKFLCKGHNRLDCTDMVTSGSRFTLQDTVSRSSFSVTISELKADDAGTYWCGSDSQWSMGDYTKIQLSVVFPEMTTPPIPHTTVGQTVTSQMTQTSGKFDIDGALFNGMVFGVPAVVLILICVLVIIYKCKGRKVQGAEVNTVTDQPKVTRARRAPSAPKPSNEYKGEDTVAYSSKFGLQRSSDYCAEDPEALYENFSTENIYCNTVN